MKMKGLKIKKIGCLLDKFLPVARYAEKNFVNYHQIDVSNQPIKCKRFKMTI